VIRIRRQLRQQIEAESLERGGVGRARPGGTARRAGTAALRRGKYL